MEVKPVGNFFGIASQSKSQLEGRNTITNYSRRDISDLSLGDSTITDKLDISYSQGKLLQEASEISNFILVASDDKYASSDSYNNNYFRETLENITNSFLNRFEKVINSPYIDTEKVFNSINENILGKQYRIDTPNDIYTYNEFSRAVQYLNSSPEEGSDMVFSDAQKKLLDPLRNFYNQFKKLKPSEN
ncbi:MAG: hypothetical protein HRT47_00415 [Candidatus Caenarcaniphilales bacterium]|nr:hypothetical protein [Candidatus Caenarcaniphilales bacterium]